MTRPFQKISLLGQVHSTFENHFWPGTNFIGKIEYIIRQDDVMVDSYTPEGDTVRQESTVSALLPLDDGKFIENEEETNVKKDDDIEERLRQVMDVRDSQAEVREDEASSGNVNGAGEDSSTVAKPNGVGGRDNLEDVDKDIQKRDNCPLDADDEDDEENLLPLQKVASLYLTNPTEPEMPSVVDICPRCKSCPSGTENLETISDIFSSTADGCDDMLVPSAVCDGGSAALLLGQKGGDKSEGSSSSKPDARTTPSILKKSSITNQPGKKGSDTTSAGQTDVGATSSFMSRMTSLPIPAGILVNRTVGLKKNMSAHPKSPKSPKQQQATKQSAKSLTRSVSYKETDSKTTKQKTFTRSASTGTPRKKVSKQVFSRVRSRGVRTGVEKSTAGARPHSFPHELRNMVDEPLLLKKSRTTNSANTVVWQFPLESKIRQNPNKKVSASEFNLTPSSETDPQMEASTAQQTEKEESTSRVKTKSDPTLTKEVEEKECVNEQPKDFIAVRTINETGDVIAIPNIDSRGSVDTGVSGSTRSTDVTHKVGNRSVRTFHPFGGVKWIGSTVNKKEKSQLSSRNKGKKKKVYTMTQGLGKGTEESKTTTVKTRVEKQIDQRRTVKKSTSIETSKERKKRFGFIPKMW